MKKPATMAPMVYAVLIRPISWVSRSCSSLLASGRFDVGRWGTAGDSRIKSGAHRVEIEIVHPVVGGLDRVEDGGIESIEDHAHCRQKGGVPLSSQLDWLPNDETFETRILTTRELFQTPSCLLSFCNLAKRLQLW